MVAARLWVFCACCTVVEGLRGTATSGLPAHQNQNKWEGERWGELKGVYGSDDRADESETHVLKDQDSVDQSQIKDAGQQTVALIHKAELFYEASSNTFKMSTTVLADAYALCAGEAFAQQPTAAFCSGTVVHWNDETKTGLVATAGHCFDDDEVSEGCQIEHSFSGLDLDVRASNGFVFATDELLSCPWARSHCSWPLPP